MEVIQYGASIGKMLGAAVWAGKKVVPLFQAVEPISSSEWTFAEAESWCVLILSLSRAACAHYARACGHSHVPYAHSFAFVICRQSLFAQS